MDFRDRDLLSSVFHFPVGLTIESVHPSVHELIIHMACCQPTMACPECHQPSARIHGRYRRTVADLPCAGRTVILALTVRTFVCGTPTCSRKITTRASAGIGGVVWAHDDAAVRAGASPWAGRRGTTGHAARRAERHHHHAVHLAAPAHAAASSHD
jgi:transposase